MFAERFGAKGGIRPDADSLTFGIILLFAGDLKIDYVARSHKGDENDQFIYFCDRLPLGAYIRNSYSFQQR
jgi:hypothetical protein